MGRNGSESADTDVLLPFSDDFLTRKRENQKEKNVDLKKKPNF